jgi:hypothetical protein
VIARQTSFVLSVALMLAIHVAPSAAQESTVPAAPTSAAAAASPSPAAPKTCQEIIASLLPLAEAVSQPNATEVARMQAVTILTATMKAHPECDFTLGK